MQQVKPELVIVQELGAKPAYRINDLSERIGSRQTAYRALSQLKELGFAESVHRGYFTLKSSIFQPYHLWPSFLPSLSALKQARRFVRTKKPDIKQIERLIEGPVTLDYKAYELTKLQNPVTFYKYVDDVGYASCILKTEGYVEDNNGGVVLLPKTGEFTNEIQRVYLDCLAAGGRYVLDAIAIELLHPADVKIRGQFPVEQVTKVQDDLPR